MATGWDRRFFASTRGQVVALLGRGRRTVEELAHGLGLTDNAVRSHLSALERDGLVRQGGVHRGPSRPAYAYELTPDADRLFPKPYGVVLAQLLDILEERMAAADLEAALREVGHRLATSHPPPTGDRHERAERALWLLGELGGLADGEERDGAFLIQGHNCPLAAAAAMHPNVCKLAESLLADVTGLSVTEQCTHAEGPRCRFELTRTSSAAVSSGTSAPLGS